MTRSHTADYGLTIERLTKPRRLPTVFDEERDIATWTLLNSTRTNLNVPHFARVIVHVPPGWKRRARDSASPQR